MWTLILSTFLYACESWTLTAEIEKIEHQGLSEPEFYGDLVYKFQKNVGRADFADQFRKIIVRYKRIGYNINIMHSLHA